MVIDALKQKLIAAGLFQSMLGAAQLATAIERRQFTAQGYVMLAKVEVAQNELINAVEQSVIETYSIVFWAAAAGDATGDKIADEIETKRAAILNALLGWAPDEEHAPFEYAGGQLAQFQVGAALWEETFRTQSYVRSVQQ